VRGGGYAEISGGPACVTDSR